MGFEVASLGVEFAATEAFDGARRPLGVDRDAAVALAFRRHKRGMRGSWRPQRAWNVFVPGLDFLQADDIPGLRAAEPPRETAAARMTGCR